ncbi:PVC-type heme-binding CxxCH protein [Maioricimonas rarisocia]|nr:PVC-type heme-binding CxxCH protein [Maioricimonas rarisocia]
MQHFQLHPDCRMELVAAEPDVIDPVAMAFDADGRLWVVEMSDYPNGPAEGQPGQSRIRVLTDDDGDGRYTNPVTFADELLFANGLLHWRDGLLVTADGNVLYLEDTDGDGKADVRETWFAGFKRDNPQLRANHPTLGLDNHIYVASGLRGGDVIAKRPEWATDAKPVSLSGRDFRFDPLTGQYEAVTGVGQFGLTFDDWGNRFVCSNRNPCKQIVLEDRYARQNPAVAVSQVAHDVSPAGEQSRVYAISRTWTTSNLHAGQFTAACGVCNYRGDALPEAFRGNSFTCEPTANLVHRDVLTPSGPTYTSRYGRDEVEFLASRDEWFRPVNLTVGPDGALYLCDMYRAVIEHPQFMPTELKTRPDLELGKDRGRIYRIVRKSAPPARPAPKLADAPSSELVQLLEHSNVWQRELAHRLLLERQDDSVADALVEMVKAGKTPQARIHALSLLEGLGQLSQGTLVAALGDDSPRVVAQAIRLAEGDFFEGDAELASRIRKIAAQTDDEALAFQAVLSMGRFPAAAGDNELLASLAAEGADEEWLRLALEIAAVDAAGVLNAMLSDDHATKAGDSAGYRDLASSLAERVGRTGSEESVGSALEAVAARDRALRENVVAGLGRGLKRRGRTFESIGKSLSNEANEVLASTFEASRKTLTADNAAPSARRHAATILEFAPKDAAEILWSTALEDADQPTLLAVIGVLARRGDAPIGPALLDIYSDETPAVRRGILDAMVANEARAAAVLDAVEAGDIGPFELTQAQQNRLLRHRNAELKKRANQLLARSVDSDRAAVIADYAPSLTMTADPLRGRELFAKNCAQCHKVGDLGVNVAPDISDSRTKTPSQLLQAILDPNRAIDNNYFSYTILDDSGNVHTGIIATETATSVTLKQPEAKTVTILRSEIEELRSNGVSLMPVGFEKAMNHQQIADLISFIKNWRYLDGQVPEEVIGR